MGWHLQNSGQEQIWPSDPRGDCECAPHSHPDAKSTDRIWEDCPKRREMDTAGNLDRSGWLMGSQAPAK